MLAIFGDFFILPTLQIVMCFCCGNLQWKKSTLKNSNIDLVVTLTKVLFVDRILIETTLETCAPGLGCPYFNQFNLKEVNATEYVDVPRICFGFRRIVLTSSSCYL